MARKQAERQPDPAGSGPEDEAVPSAEHPNWKTSPGGPPVPDDAYEPPPVVRGVSN
jgi:hypothetical protein